MEMKTAVQTLGAIAQETRLSILRLLIEAGPTGLAAGEIASSVGVSPTNLSFHLKELAHAGLARSRQEGRYVFYSADYARMNALVAFLTENCCARDGACRPCPPEKAKSTTAEGTRS
jgi:ArsR family transcriptional regulator, arsenate/arsenite/antimonite-responsive transcriptional repressor